MSIATSWDTATTEIHEDAMDPARAAALWATLGLAGARPAGRTTHVR